MKQVRPKKNLGQHFLVDLNIAKRIADTVDEPFADLPVLEVGPGMGVMTVPRREAPPPEGGRDRPRECGLSERDLV